MAFALSACELNETCDPAVDQGCEVADADSGGDTTQDTTPDTPTTQSYNYVLLEDLDQNASGDRPGADIDAIELRSGGSSFFLSQIHESGRGGVEPTGANGNFNNALGQPDGQDCVGANPNDWDLTSIVSLGGLGGYLVGSFQGLEEINAGDSLTIYACAGQESENWEVAVGVGRTRQDPDWQTVIASGRATVTITVPTLEVVEGR